MSAQDILLSAAYLSFLVALVRAVLAREKPPLFTSSVNAVGLTVAATALGTLRLYFAAATTAAAAMLWFILAIQVIARDFDSVPGDGQ